MINSLLHDLAIEPTRDEQSRQEFVSSLRSHILVDMASSMRDRYASLVEPRFEAQHGRQPKDGGEVHDAIKQDLYFKFYSSIRYNAQEMVWRSVIPVVDRNLDSLVEQANALRHDEAKANGSLKTDASFKVPTNVSKIDVHLSPGGYHSEYTENDVAAGAIYDNGLNIFAANLMGRNLDDIGESFSNYVKHAYSEFKPQHILDCGCTIGHNTIPWAKAFPDASVHAIDVSAPALRYGNARAQAQSVDIHFQQMNATNLQFEDNSFDIVFSSMFLHELPLKDIRAFFAEAYRVLKPGGLLLNMELPPNDQMSPYDSFYLDWDCFYNAEPYYKTFRDQNYQTLCSDAGFDPQRFVQITTPQYGYMSEEDFKASIGAKKSMDDKTGRLTAGIEWFAFGAWKG